jgi:hypothetical protein
MNEPRDQASGLRREAEVAAYLQWRADARREFAADVDRRMREPYPAYPIHTRRPPVVPTLLVWLWRLCVTAALLWLAFR